MQIQTKLNALKKTTIILVINKYNKKTVLITFNTTT